MTPTERREIGEAVFHLRDCVSSRPDVLATAIRILERYRDGKLVHIPNKEKIKRCVEKNGWDLRVLWMPDCNDDTNSDHFDCPVYRWNEDESKAIESLTIAIIEELKDG